MTSVLFDAETGTNGTTLTTGNSGFDSVTGSPIFSTAAAARGSLGYRWTYTGAGNGICRIDDFQGTATRIRCAFAIKISAAPSNALQVSYWTDAANAALLPRIVINTNRTLTAQGGANTTLFTGATALALNTWYRVELVWIPGATTTTGTIGFGYALLDDPINSGGSDYYYATNVNTGTADGVGRWNLPKLSGTWTATVDLDDIRADDTTTFTSDPATWLGPTAVSVSPDAPTAFLSQTAPDVTPSADQTVTTATALLSLTAPPASPSAGASPDAPTAALALVAGPVSGVVPDATVAAPTAFLSLSAPDVAAGVQATAAAPTAFLSLVAAPAEASGGASAQAPTALLTVTAPSPAMTAAATAALSTALLYLTAPPVTAMALAFYRYGWWNTDRWSPVATRVWTGTSWDDVLVTVTDD